ncbi:hypothetical protein DY000_02018726 [Brassica cretica]|uniref:RNase H type-1 domain-containing protein n=1 Tax=Brassica cretica TaxID=69181 RepID=A0ABQ7CQA7_BRACR|nr:hypothetical protein DY000_02018726 [Brassica cretica]
MRIPSIRFQKDYSDLSGYDYEPDGVAYFCDRDRDASKLQEDFEDVSLSHIPRSRNGRADVLAKEARRKGYIFSHMDQTRTDKDAPRRIVSSATT